MRSWHRRRPGIADLPPAHDPLPVNLNTASADELAARLPGIGPSRATAIVAGRPWSAVEDLAGLSGVSPAMVLGWKTDPGLEL